MKRRPFAVERRRLAPAKAVERVSARSAVSGWLKAPTASTPRETRGMPLPGPLAEDCHRLLQHAPLRFPHDMVSDETGVR